MQLMLHSHPRIAIPPENRFVLSAYYERTGFGDLREPNNRRVLARFIVKRKRTQFRDYGLDKRQITKAIAAGPPTVGGALAIVFRAYAERFGKERWGDKRPGYHSYVPALVRMFPDAQFIQLVRDGRDCVASLKKMPWWRRDIYQSVVEWNLAVDNARRSARRLSADRFHQIRYEDLVADPERELKALCAFLGEEYDPAMIAPKEVADVAVPERKKWHENTHRDVSESAIGKWQQALEPEELALCETVMGKRLRAQGYELTGAPRASLASRFRYYRVVASRQRFLRTRFIKDWFRRTFKPTPLAYSWRGNGHASQQPVRAPAR